MRRVLHVVENPVESRFMFHLFRDLKSVQACESHMVNVCQGEPFFAQMKGLLASYTSFGATRRYFLRFPVLLKALRRIRPDLVHAHEFIPAAYAAVSLVLTRSRAKLIYHRHHTATTGWKARLLDHIAAWKADQILTVSTAAAETARQEHPRYKNKIAASWNGVAVSEPPHVSTTDRREILLLARLRPGKGHEVAIAAFAKVLHRFPDAVLIFAGEGPYREHLEQVARETGFSKSIEFLGHVDDPSSLIQRCQLMIVPSLSEAFGLVAVEAMALKKLVIASRVGGLAEIIAHNESGILVAPADVEGLAREILHYLEHTEDRERLAQAGYKRYLAEFTSAAMAKRLSDVYSRSL